MSFYVAPIPGEGKFYDFMVNFANMRSKWFERQESVVSLSMFLNRVEAITCICYFTLCDIVFVVKFFHD